ncbi:MAG: ATP--guanido phosphotransferase [Clostridiales bacterium]|nr:ATP--guanido phosphotransferase [Clostridiales bacterium]
MEKESGFIQSTVISTRIRLARNFAAFPFPAKMDEQQASDVVYLVERGLDELDEFKKYDMQELQEDEINLLQEAHLISPALSRSKRGAAFVSKDNAISIMVNEEDHLRLQYIFDHYDVYKAYERISAVDESLGSMFDFAFDKKLGYLTACPSNLGTGMRASVMMFLPGFARSGGLKKLLPSLRKSGLTVRGAFGEGSTAEGYLYQISNERTLGLSEMELLDQMNETMLSLCDLENREREKMMATSEVEIRDRCLRAYGALTHCAILPSNEFLLKMADVKLGILLGFFKTEDLRELHGFIDGMRPHSFRIANGLRDLDERACDEARASTVGRVLPELVQIK